MNEYKINCMLLLLMCICIAGIPACSYFKAKPELSAEENYNNGMKEFEDKDYEDAIPYFEKIIENYPFSKYALASELKIAESYFLDEKYMEAVVHLQGFEELHPTNENIPYVIWMKGVSYFEQASSIDRDMTSLENAEREFLKLQSRFPENSFREKGDAVLKEVRERLARHDFYVAKFYYRDGYYEPAIRRIEKVLREYPELGFKDRLYYYLGKSYFFLQDNGNAKTAFTSLLGDFPDSSYAPRARMFMNDIEKGRFTIVSRYFRFKERALGWFGYE